MVGTVNLIPLAINKIEGNHVPYLPSSDWARNKFVVESDQQYKAGKLLGGTGVMTLATAGLGAAAGGSGAAASQAGTIVVQAEGGLAVAAAGTAVSPVTAAAVGGMGVGAIGQTVQMSVGNSGGSAPNGLGGHSIQDLSNAAGVPDRGGFTAAGRSLTKHGSGARPGNSLFPAAKGNPAQINAQAQAVVDEILNNPGTTFTKGFRGRFGDTIEAAAPDGRGIVFDANGKFLFFKE